MCVCVSVCAVCVCVCVYLGGVCGRVSRGAEGGSRDGSSVIGQLHLVGPRLPGDELQLLGLWAQP